MRGSVKDFAKHFGLSEDSAGKLLAYGLLRYLEVKGLAVKLDPEKKAGRGRPTDIYEVAEKTLNILASMSDMVGEITHESEIK